MPLPKPLERVLAQTPELARAYLVGGCVRDWLMGAAPKDFDIEVFGVDYATLGEALRRWGRVDLVGKSFGVIKLNLDGVIYDFSLPRRDSKVGSGHRGFDIAAQPELSPAEAAARRDFTINALLYDPRERRVIDPFGARKDIANRVLRHATEAFIEDPLRALRGMQFAARFDLTAAPETLELCRSIRSTHNELPVERLREEWMKWATKSTKPSAGLNFLRDSGWVEHYPEIRDLIGTPQDPEWHPEGDVFVHTCHCCDAMASLAEWQQSDEISRAVYMFAILTHDFSKPHTTHCAVKRGRWRIVSPGHEQEGGPVASRFLERIGIPLAIRERVVPLVMNHMAHFQAPSARAVRKLSERLQPENIYGLALVMQADQMGRPPRPATMPQSVRALLAKAEELAVMKEPPSPLIMGRDLLDRGMSPGPEVGAVVRRAYEAQLNGDFSDREGALAWLARQDLKT